MREIIEWFENGCDYASGIELYQKYGNDRRLKRFVFIPENNQAAFKNRLKGELAEIAGIDLLKPIPISGKKSVEKTHKKQKRAITPEQRLKKDLPEIDYTKLPDDLKILTFDRVGLYHRANKARYDVHQAKSDSERFALIHEEITCRRENELIWEELIHFDKTGKILGKHPRFQAAAFIDELNKKTKAELFTMLSNFPSYRCKVKKQIEKLKDEDKILKKQKLLSKYDLQEKEVKRILEIDE